MEYVTHIQHKMQHNIFNMIMQYSYNMILHYATLTQCFSLRVIHNNIFYLAGEVYLTQAVRVNVAHPVHTPLK